MPRMARISASVHKHTQREKDTHTVLTTHTLLAIKRPYLLKVCDCNGTSQHITFNAVKHSCKLILATGSVTSWDARVDHALSPPVPPAPPEGGGGGGRRRASFATLCGVRPVLLLLLTLPLPLPLPASILAFALGGVLGVRMNLGANAVASSSLSSTCVCAFVDVRVGEGEGG
jgi:hypothetical protein